MDKWRKYNGLTPEDVYASYDVYILKNTDKNFYSYVGPFLANRKVAKALGLPCWDDDNKIWVILREGHNTIAISSFAVEKKKFILKSSYVKERYRNQGIYTYMTKKRLLIISSLSDNAIVEGTATEMSSPIYEKLGFTYIFNRGKYKVFRKEL